MNTLGSGQRCSHLWGVHNERFHCSLTHIKMFIQIDKYFWKEAYKWTLFAMDSFSHYTGIKKNFFVKSFLGTHVPHDAGIGNYGNSSVIPTFNCH